MKKLMIAATLLVITNAVNADDSILLRNTIESINNHQTNLFGQKM